MPDQFKPKSANFEQRVIDSFDRQTAMKTVGASIIKVSAGEVSIQFPFDPDLTQQHGFIHAGIVSTVLDSACGYAAFSLMPDDAAVLTIEFKINLLSPAQGEWFEAIGRVKKPGRNITVTEGELYEHQGDTQKMVASMVGTMMAVYDRDQIHN
ncbi:MAG: PaaI family thioesterase [Gammaproteobacteria bacterium]